MNHTPRYVLRRMRYEDIPQVVVIDRQSFPMPWSASVYRYEIGQNSYSTMVVVCRYEPSQADREPTGLTRLLDRLMGRNHESPHRIVLGYGGFWLNQGEAHISTIASHPAYRRQGLGELLLAGMIRRSLNLDATRISLEVRVSNAAAISLYRKYGFVQVGVKPHYYRDNMEDALDMRVDPIDGRYRAFVAEHWEALAARLAFLDAFTSDDRATGKIGPLDSRLSGRNRA